jgi:acetyl-CoA C-acetyltransferase
MQDVFILSGVRTPVGKFQGALSPLSAPQLGAAVVREAVRRAGIEGAKVDEVIMGNVLSAGLGQNPARQAALHAGLPYVVAAMTINKVCGSGLKAVALAAQAIQTGNANVVAAGGMESMSNAPYLLPQARTGLRLGDGKVVDSMVHDGLWDCYEDCHMGMTGEAVAQKYGITREEQDAFACASHRKAVEAMKAGRFQAEILPLDVPAPKAQVVRVEKDECPREDTTEAALARLRPAFKKDGTVTAGNAPGVNDGAAALVVAPESLVRSANLKPLARIVGQAISGIEPIMVMMAPVEAVNRLLAKVGWDRDEVDLFELNEAFSVQSIAVIRELRLDPAKVNVNGGAVALGHPIGASGARILVTLLYEMQARNARRGVAGLCLGGGNAVALAVERP